MQRLTEAGDISGAVETEAGTHFIRLEERIAGDSVDYDAVRDDLRASIEAAEAERNLLIAVEELRDLAFNAPDLAAPAAAIGGSGYDLRAFLACRRRGSVCG